MADVYGRELESHARGSSRHKPAPEPGSTANRQRIMATADTTLTADRDWRRQWAHHSVAPLFKVSTVHPRHASTRQRSESRATMTDTLGTPVENLPPALARDTRRQFPLLRYGSDGAKGPTNFSNGSRPTCASRLTFGSRLVLAARQAAPIPISGPFVTRRSFFERSLG